MESFAALADPTRRKIVEMLADGEMSAGDIAARFAVSPPAVSQHLKALKQARLVRVRVDAQRRFYELDPGGFVELDSWLNSIGKFWSRRLDRLEEGLRQAAEDDKKQGSDT